jgi:hypothetical protein
MAAPLFPSWVGTLKTAEVGPQGLTSCFPLVPEERLELSYPQGVGDFESFTGTFCNLLNVLYLIVFADKRHGNIGEPLGL